jgi:Uma2 family endonuclease
MSGGESFNMAEEFANVDFNEARLEKRFVRTMETLSRQPDISVICDESKRGSEGCHGAPDMVVEILSPSNTAIEMQRKLELYQDAGVREYWIVDSDHNVRRIESAGFLPALFSRRWTLQFCSRASAR